MRAAYALLALSFVAAGCSLQQPPLEKTRYVLAVDFPSHAQPGDGADDAEGGVLRVHRFQASPLFERKGFVYRTAPEQFVDDFYNEFYAAPGVMLREVAVRWLRGIGLFSQVLEPSQSGRADWLLEARIDELHADLIEPGQAIAVVGVEFTLFDEQSGDREVLFQKGYEVEERAAEVSAESIVSAWVTATESIFTEFSQDLGNVVRERAKARAEAEAEAEESSE